MVIKNKQLKFIVDCLLVLVGGFFMAFAFNTFLFPSEILPSGFSGIATIISVLFAKYGGIDIPVSVVYILLNIILYILALKSMGKRFAILSLIGIVGYTLFLQFANFNINLTVDPLLFALYGGIIAGLGTGIMLRGRGSTGGSELLASIINKKYPNFTVGNVLICINALVIFASILVYGISSALYSLIAIFLAGRVADFVVAGVQSVRAYYIISYKNSEIAKRIMEEVARGVTGMSVSGMYTKASQTMLLVLVNRGQVAHLKYIVADCDENAFIFSCPVTEVSGGGFVPLKKNGTILYNYYKHRKRKYKRFVANNKIKFHYDIKQLLQLNKENKNKENKNKENKNKKLKEK